MEVEARDEVLVSSCDLLPWNMDSLRTVVSESLHETVYAINAGVLQRVYHYTAGPMAELTLRRSIGLQRLGSKTDLMWLQGRDAQGRPTYLGIDAEYVFERTGMLTSPSIVLAANQTTVPILDVLIAVTYELEPILGFEVETLMTEQDIAEKLPSTLFSDYLSLDLRRRSKLVLCGDSPVIDSLENSARDYCVDYWQCTDKWAAAVKHVIGLGLYPSKRLWEIDELGNLQIGDLLALQGLRTSPDQYRLRGFLRLLRHQSRAYKYEVQFNMENEQVNLEFASDGLQEAEQNALHIQSAPHEQIEMEIIAGRTTIPLSELCAVQSGTLIELGRHNLPMVTLSVNGEAVLEGELVHFKDQIMVQITKRLV